MDCPRCSHVLTPYTVENLEVDICKGGCGGIWFDSFELQQVDEDHETIGEALIEIEQGLNVVPDFSKRIYCPRCDNIILMRHFWSVKRDTEIDECPSCGGFWLDAGELHRIRRQFQNQEERKAEFEKVFGELFGEEVATIQSANTKTRKAGFLTRFFWRHMK